MERKHQERSIIVSPSILMALSLVAFVGCLGPDSEALQRVKKYTWSHITSCGDSSYTGKVEKFQSGRGWFKDSPAGDYLLEIKDIYFKVNRQNITEAQKLNGLEYEAQIEVRGVAYRTAVKLRDSAEAPCWGGWSDNPSEGALGIGLPVAYIDVSKNDGNWSIASSLSSNHTVDCKQMEAIKTCGKQ